MTPSLAARKPAAYRPRLLGRTDLPELLALQQDATHGLPEGFFRGKDELGLRAYLDGTLGVAYGIVDGSDVLRAAALLRLPDAAHPNPDAGPRFPIVPAADWPCHAAFLENAMVHPDDRGRGHQRALLDLRIAHAAATGMRWACAASHLHNVASWSNLLARDLVIAGLIERNGQPVIGLLRAIGAARLATDFGENKMVPLRDKARHLAALGDGFVGVARRGDAVIYRRRAR
jgi:ribosomal protein S18 acetylase RimI-like enzyme